MGTTPSISLILPVYNEVEIIRETVSIYSGVLLSFAYDFEIIVVNDASTDGTGQVLREVALFNKHVKVVTHRENLGSGKSVVSGFKEAQKDICITNFADRPFDLNELPNIVALFDNSDTDFVVVTRKDRSSNPTYRKITSYLNYWLIRLLFNMEIGDFQFIQCYKRKIFEEVDLNAIISRHTFVAPELILKSLKKGFKVREYKSFFYPRKKGKSKYNNVILILKSALEIIYFWYYWINSDYEKQ